MDPRIRKELQKRPNKKEKQLLEGLNSLKKSGSWAQRNEGDREWGESTSVERGPYGFLSKNVEC